MNQALFIIDVQNGFITDSIVEGIVEKIEKVAHEFKGPILASKFINESDSNYEKLMGWEGMKDTEEISIPDGILRAKPFVFSKQSYSSATKEALDFLREKSIKEIYICGIDTDQCVLATAFDLFSKDFKINVIADCCASAAGQLFHEYGLALLARSVGRDQIISSHALLVKQRENI